MNANICVLWLILLICGNCLKFGNCFKCEFKRKRLYYCYVTPDSSSIKEKHLDGETDDNVKIIQFNGAVNIITHLTSSELAPLCQRFKNKGLIEINDVKSVTENLFQLCKNLKKVVIKNLETENLPEKIFYENLNLTSIRVVESKLKTLPENIFINQKELKSLYLADNQISFLPSNIFNPLTNLHFLTLSRNKIRSLNPKWFENLQLLSQLWLDYNKIQDLPNNVFTHLMELWYLNLDGNQLTTIHSDSFGNNKNLCQIKLSKNKINAIDGKSFDKTSFYMIYLSGNICSNDNIEREYGGPKPTIKCGTRNIVIDAVINGLPIIRNELPWNAAMLNGIGHLFCGGSLISNRHVVTAAHCIKGKSDSHVFGTGDIYVLLGVYNYTKSEEEGRVQAYINSITIHPDWNTDVQNYDSDIAVLELVSEVPFNNFIRPICIANKTSPVANAPNGTVVGFGLNEDKSLSPVAKKLNIPIRKFHECTTHSEGHRDLVSAKTFCGGPANGSGVCIGDSGGGVHVLHDGIFYLRGLVSATLLNVYLECDVHREAIFADVTRFYDWIKDVQSNGN